MAFEDIYRILSSRNLAVNSTGGAAVSTAVLSSQTYAVQVCYAGSTSSTAGVRIAIIDPVGAAADSTSALLPPAWIQVYKCTPGQKISAISNDAGTPTLNIVELTK